MRDYNANLHEQEILEIEFLEGVYRRCPDYVPLLIPLGDMYTQQGRFHDGLNVDLRLAELCPNDATVWYNLACSFSLTNSLPKGIDALRKALDLGYTDSEHLQEDRDLDNLRPHPDFPSLIRKLEQASPDG